MASRGVNKVILAGVLQGALSQNYGHAQRLCFLLVDIDLVLRRIFQTVWTHANQ